MMMRGLLHLVRPATSNDLQLQILQFMKITTEKEAAYDERLQLSVDEDVRTAAVRAILAPAGDKE